MKNNVISNSNMVTFGKNGSIEIIGLNPSRSFHSGSIMILAKSEDLDYLRNSIPDFCGKCNTMFAPDESDTVVMVFEYSLRDKLRNPQKLLKSIRNKLMRAIYSVQSEIDAEEDSSEYPYGWPG